MRTLYHLHGMQGHITTETSATAARRFLQNGRNLAARVGRRGTFGRTVLVATYDNGRPVHVRTYPRH